MTGFERITWLYKELKDNRYPNRQQFMARFEVSPSTFKRDLSFFRDRLSAPIEYDEKRRGYFLTNSAFELPSFWFNHRQLLIIAAVCRQLEQFTTSPTIKNLITRLQEIITAPNGRRMEIFSFENAACVSCDNANFDTLSQAMLMERLIHITYRDGKNDHVSCRDVEPYRLHNYAGSWYLIAFCRLRRAPRTFQLSRILDIEVLRKNVEQRFNVNDYLATAFGIFKGRDTTTATLRFCPALARLINEQCWHPNQITRWERDGSLIMELPVADLTEIRLKTLQYGREVEVISPPELRRQVAAEARAMAEMYYAQETGDRKQDTGG